jgi:hypothetical protein
MNDDWRLRIDLHEEGHTNALVQGLEAKELEHDLETSFHDRVIVSRDGPEVFCYAATREQAEQASKLISSLAVENGWHPDSELTHWHPTAERWEDADTPLPASDAERAAERAELMSQERQESLAAGQPQWEVRVQCASHHDASQLAEKLQREGLRTVHRWRYLLVGATDEDSANALADRIRQDAPAGSTEIVEGSAATARAAMPSNPFAVFGGLAG